MFSETGNINTFNLPQDLLLHSIPSTLANTLNVCVGKVDTIEPKETTITPSSPELIIKLSNSGGRLLAGRGKSGPVTINAVMGQNKGKKIRNNRGSEKQKRFVKNGYPQPLFTTTLVHFGKVM